LADFCAVPEKPAGLPATLKCRVLFQRGGHAHERRQRRGTGPVSIVTINRSEKLNPEPSEAQDTSVKPL
jgi:hypothetical protein